MLYDVRVELVVRVDAVTAQDALDHAEQTVGYWLPDHVHGGRQLRSIDAVDAFANDSKRAVKP